MMTVKRWSWWWLTAMLPHLSQLHEEEKEEEAPREQKHQKVLAPTDWTEISSSLSNTPPPPRGFMMREASHTPTHPAERRRRRQERRAGCSASCWPATESTGRQESHIHRVASQGSTHRVPVLYLSIYIYVLVLHYSYFVIFRTLSIHDDDGFLY